jgi:HSP20 family molecular chaperone IbpA
MSLAHEHSSPNSNTFFEDEWSVFDPDAAALVHCDSGIVGRTNITSESSAPLLTSDLIESDADFHLYADLPGVNVDDLQVSIDNNQLTIKAERKHVHTKGSDKVHSMERSYGQFTRTMRIPNNVDLANVVTLFRNGVLTVSFPKIEPSPTETIFRKLSIGL